MENQENLNKILGELSQEYPDNDYPTGDEHPVAETGSVAFNDEPTGLGSVSAAIDKDVQELAEAMAVDVSEEEEKDARLFEQLRALASGEQGVLDEEMFAQLAVDSESEASRDTESTGSTKSTESTKSTKSTESTESVESTDETIKPTTPTLSPNAYRSLAQPVHKLKFYDYPTASPVSTPSPVKNTSDTEPAFEEEASQTGSMVEEVEATPGFSREQLVEDVATVDPETNSTNQLVLESIVKAADLTINTSGDIKHAVALVKNQSKNAFGTKTESDTDVDFDNRLRQLLEETVPDLEKRELARVLVPTPSDVIPVSEVAKFDKNTYLTDKDVPDTALLLLVSQARVSAELSQSSVDQQVNDQSSRDALANTLLEFARSYVIPNLDSLLDHYFRVIDQSNRLEEVLRDSVVSIRREYMEKFETWLEERVAELKREYLAKHPPLLDSDVEQLKNSIHQTSQKSVVQATEELLNTRREFARHVIDSSNEPVFAAVRRHLTAIDYLDKSLREAAKLLGEGSHTLKVSGDGTVMVEPDKTSPEKDSHNSVVEEDRTPTLDNVLTGLVESANSPEPVDDAGVTRSVDELLADPSSEQMVDLQTVSSADDSAVPDVDIDETALADVLGSNLFQPATSEPSPQPVEQPVVNSTVEAATHPGVSSDQSMNKFDELISPTNNRVSVTQMSELEKLGLVTEPAHARPEPGVVELESSKPKSKVGVVLGSLAGAVLALGLAFGVTGYVWPGFMKDQVTSAQENPRSGQITAETREALKQVSGKYRVGDGLELVTRNGIIKVEIIGFNVDGAVAEDASGDKWLITNDQLRDWLDKNPDEFAQREAVDNLGGDDVETAAELESAPINMAQAITATENTDRAS